MRSQSAKYILIGILSVGLFGCPPSKPAAPAAPERLPVEPPAGWRLAAQQWRQDNSYAETFYPKQRSYYEKFWVDILHQPENVAKPMDQLLREFRPHFICQSEDMNVLKKDPNEMIFEEKDSICYGKTYRLTIARIVKGPASVSFYAYRADRPDVPEDHRDFVLKTITSAPFEIIGGPQPNQPAAASAVPPPNATSH